MCENCDTPQSTMTRNKRRASLGDIDSARHCAIIGTCLSLAELKSVANKFSDYVKEKASDYEIHAAIVHMASRDKKLAKVLTKMLDRKYAALLSRFSKAENDDQLLDSWNEAVSRGDIGGGLWAILSSALASDDLCSRVYGEVHMMSHQISASLRQEIKGTHQLEQANKELRQDVETLRGRLNSDIAVRDAEIRELKQKLEAETTRANRLARASSLQEELDNLKAQLNDAKKRLVAEQETQESLKASLRMAESFKEDVGKQLQALTEENSHLKREAEVSERRIMDILRPAAASLAGCDNSCSNLDLCGRCILFVGGRNQHVPHLRRIVENCNGAFAHHDGGLEESLGLLPGMIGRADAVLFAVDNISHAAQDELKRHCKHQDRMFVPVRRSGIAAYLQALQTLAEENEQMN